MSEENHLELLTKFVAAREKKPKWALFALKATAEYLLPENRLKVCYHHRLPNVDTVEIWLKTKEKKAYYRGLMKCGQAWVCPVCAQRIAQVRKEMMREALDNSRTKYFPVLFTYTAQHYKGQPLSKLLAGMVTAYSQMRRQRLWRTYREEYMMIGEVRALEITYGDSGWHPHFHVVLFLDIEILQYYRDGAGGYRISDLCTALRRHITPMWIHELETVKLTALDGPGLDVRAGWDTLDDYITKQGNVLPAQGDKWGIAEEITMGQQKQSKREGKSPWDLLVYAFVGDWASGELFKEYVAATKGRSGLQFSPGLKAKLGVTKSDDSEADCDEHDINDILLLSLSVEQWRAVVGTAATGVLLDTCSSGDPQQIEALLDKIEQKFESEKVRIPD